MRNTYSDRADAGNHLARALLGQLPELSKVPSETLVLGLARGGIPIAFEVARALGCPFDALVVRKLGLPNNEELAFGAIAPADCQWLNLPLIRQAQLTESQIKGIVQVQRAELARREAKYFASRTPAAANKKTVILVDDGIATGATMRVAIKFARQSGAHKIVVAVPVATAESRAALTPEVSAFVCPLVPDNFRAVGQFYEKFDQLTDDEVVEWLGLAD